MRTFDNGAISLGPVADSLRSRAAAGDCPTKTEEEFTSPRVSCQACSAECSSFYVRKAEGEATRRSSGKWLLGWARLWVQICHGQMRWPENPKSQAQPATTASSGSGRAALFE